MHLMLPLQGRLGETLKDDAPSNIQPEVCVTLQPTFCDTCTKSMPAELSCVSSSKDILVSAMQAPLCGLKAWPKRWEVMQSAVNMHIKSCLPPQDRAHAYLVIQGGPQ